MKKVIASFICFCLLSFVSLMANAQDGESTIVQGKVVDKQKKPIAGVTVAEVDAEQRTIRAVTTDVEGNFAIRISNKKDKLSFSFIGYKTVTQNIGDKTSFSISLETNNQDLGEVVVISQRRVDNGMVAVPERDQTISSARISAKEMEEMQASSIDQALQGRLAGVDISALSGDPGVGMQIRIRGTSSINGSADPLIVVDGMPYETQIPSDFNFSTADENGYAQLLNIAPTDIKEIAILKDAAATALWGSRAANGVLLITTKRGTVGKPVFSYTFKGSITKQPDAIPMLTGDQYSSLIPEAFMNRNGTPLNTQLFKEFQYDPTDPYWYYNYSNNTDWLGAITRLGVIQDHTVSMQGGGERAKYYTSVNFLNNKGTTVGTNLNRIGMRINLDYNVSDRLVFRTNLSISHTDNDRLYADGIRDLAYRKMPNMSIYEYDALGNLTPNYFSPTFNIQGQFIGVGSNGSILGTANPVAMANAAKRKVITDRVTPLFKIEYDIIKGVLKSYFDVQFDINNTKDRSFLPQIATGRPINETSVNRASDADLDVFNVTTNTKLVYTPKFNNPKHDVLSYITFYTYDNNGVSHQALTANTPSSELQDPSVPSRTQNSDLSLRSGGAQTRNIASTFSVQYKFMDRYIIQAGARGEGHSRLAPKSRYGVFPNVSARYRISGEPFMEKFTKKFLDDLSIRASYGNTPNAPRNDYSFFNIYSNFPWTYLGRAGTYPANMELQNLRWEIVSGRNLGLNLDMFKNRFNLAVDVYRIRTKDLFFRDLQISSFTGFDRVDMNVGTMDNDGWEVALNTIPLKTKKWTIDFNFNIARNINMIREISEFYPRERGVVTQNGVYKTYMQENNPFGSFYGFKYAGVYKDKDATIARDAAGKPIIGPNGQVIYMRFNYPSIDYVFQPGDAMYEDINKDGNINEQDIVYLGNGNPQYVGGFGSSITFNQNLKLSAFFNYRYNYEIVNGTKMNSTKMYNYDNQSTAVLRRWRKEGDVTDMPRALIGAGYNWLGSDRYVEDASFLRFRSLTLRYTLPKTVLSRMKIKSLSAYVTAENLITWTKYTGQDPEVSARGSDPFRVAFDNATTPPVKMFTLGLTGSF